MVLGAVLVVAGALGYSGMVPLANMLPQELTSVVLSVVGLVLIVTAYFQKCPLYRLLGMDTSEGVN